MKALTGEVLALDEHGTWRVVRTPTGAPVNDRRRGGAGMTADCVILDEEYRVTFDEASRCWVGHVTGWAT